MYQKDYVVFFLAYSPQISPMMPQQIPYSPQVPITPQQPFFPPGILSGPDGVPLYGDIDSSTNVFSKR
jgi:hypothetical protein